MPPWPADPDALAQGRGLIGVVQRLTNFQCLDPVSVRPVAVPLIVAQVAQALERPRQADLVVVAPVESQRAGVVLARELVVVQRPRGVAKVQQRDAMAARVLDL